MADQSYTATLTCRVCTATILYENERPDWKPYEPIDLSGAAINRDPTRTYTVQPPFNFVDCPSCGARISSTITGPIFSGVRLRG